MTSATVSRRRLACRRHKFRKTRDGRDAGFMARLVRLNLDWRNQDMNSRRWLSLGLLCLFIRRKLPPPPGLRGWRGRGGYFFVRGRRSAPQHRLGEPHGEQLAAAKASVTVCQASQPICHAGASSAICSGVIMASVDLSATAGCTLAVPQRAPSNNVPVAPKISSAADTVVQPSTANNPMAGCSTSWSSV